jgi:hypothetical protein
MQPVFWPVVRIVGRPVMGPVMGLVRGTVMRFVIRPGRGTLLMTRWSIRFAMITGVIITLIVAMLIVPLICARSFVSMIGTVFIGLFVWAAILDAWRPLVYMARITPMVGTKFRIMFRTMFRAMFRAMFGTRVPVFLTLRWRLVPWRGAPLFMTAFGVVAW